MTHPLVDQLRFARSEFERLCWPLVPSADVTCQEFEWTYYSALTASEIANFRPPFIAER